jgi:hypothetical protein
MDFCPNTLVAFLQQRPQPLDNVTLMHIFLPICRAVEAMHCLVPPLAHRCAACICLRACVADL